MSLGNTTQTRSRLDIKTDLKIAPKQTITSYIVESCPYYVPDLEAQIAAMSHEEIAKRLEISNRFVRSHQKLSRQVLYVYTKQYVKESRKQYAKTGVKKLDAATRYEMKKHIVEQILLSTQEELLDEAEAKAESSDDMRYNREMNQIEPDCQEMLRKLEWAYKNKSKGKSKSKEATASVR